MRSYIILLFYIAANFAIPSSATTPGIALHGKSGMKKPFPFGRPTRRAKRNTLNKRSPVTSNVDSMANVARPEVNQKGSVPEPKPKMKPNRRHRFKRGRH